MKSYTLQIVKETEDNSTCKVPFVCITDTGKYSLIYKGTDNYYSAIDLETGQQINAQHITLNGLFNNFPKTLGRIIESELRVLE